jgi:hypothetical protein
VKRLAIVLVLCSCKIGPNLVSAPMATSAPVGPLIAPDGDGSPDDPEATPSDDLSGQWNGRAWQSGKSWLMTLTFERRGKEVLVRSYYPDQRCRAETLLRSTDARHWVGDENVTVDPLNRCPNHGHVTIELLDEDTMSWRWTGSGGVASSSLTRTQQRGD